MAAYRNLGLVARRVQYEHPGTFDLEEGEQQKTAASCNVAGYFSTTPFSLLPLCFFFFVILFFFLVLCL